MPDLHAPRLPVPPAPPPDSSRPWPQRIPVLIAGGGPVGLTLAALLARQGIAALVVEADDGYCAGSRAICMARRSLEILGWAGADRATVATGLPWVGGRSYYRDTQVLHFQMPSEPDERFAPMVNIQQYYLEAFAHDAALRGASPADVRFGTRLRTLRQHPSGVVAEIETGDGVVQVDAQWLVACDGGRSTVREQLGLRMEGTQYEGRYVIVDIVQKTRREVERLAWFDPPSNPGSTLLMHRQPDDVWRIDLQLNRYADPVVEKKPENVRPRIARMLGHDKFEFEWISLYKFQCRRMDRFIHGRVIFAGDSAHQVSPFGARGANSGLEDAENLSWKLDRVLRGTSPASLLESYHAERSMAADENIRESTRSTDFMAPNSHQEARLRKAVLSLAKETEFGKRMVNGGRLSVPCSYDTSLSSPDADMWGAGPRPGCSMLDAPVATSAGEQAYLTDAFRKGGTDFTLLSFSNGTELGVPEGVKDIRIGGEGGLADPSGLVARRYDADAGAAYLLRPDGYVAARFRHPTRETIAAALSRAEGLN